MHSTMLFRSFGGTVSEAQEHTAAWFQKPSGFRGPGTYWEPKNNSDPQGHAFSKASVHRAVLYTGPCFLKGSVHRAVLCTGPCFFEGSVHRAVLCTGPF